MNAHDHTIEHLFRYGFPKMAEEIVAKAAEKAETIKAKIEERIRRVHALREEYGIDDAAYITLLQQARKQQQAMSYTYSNSIPVGGSAAAGGKMEERIIGAGVVNNLLTESDFIEAEKDQVKRLGVMVRNLKPCKRFSNNGVELPPSEFTLSYEEIEYLGF